MNPGDSSSSRCPFCELSPQRIWLEDDVSIAFRDGYPVSLGHTLLIPRHHVASVFDLPDHEQARLWARVAAVRRLLEEELHPDGFNVGLNDGLSAGQTVMHAHIHLIPRFKGDVPDPRGGVRWVIPAKARYWENQ
jgi:diadenosine tetraphosphate (Ap4A) HIT family hydrolase